MMERVYIISNLKEVMEKMKKNLRHQGKGKREET